MDPLVILALLRLGLALGGTGLMWWMFADRDSRTFPLWTRWTVGLVGFAMVVYTGFGEVIGW